MKCIRKDPARRYTSPSQLLGNLTALIIIILVIGCSANGKINRPPQSPPEDMVLVPAGGFLMGNNNDYYDNDFDEKPQHLVDLPAFYIDKYEVTNAQYKKFVDATGHQPPRFWDKNGNYQPEKSEHPVVGVTWFDADAYARWTGKRLPTEAEWEKAARGTDARRWPWGNTFNPANLNLSHKDTMPLGSYSNNISPWGAYDMSGNVWEWTQDWYDLYPNSPDNQIVSKQLGQTHKVVRGGGYTDDVGSTRCADRGARTPDHTGPSLGFRCTRDVPGYEHYRSAAAVLKQIKELKPQVRLDITEYEEHEPARQLLQKSEFWEQQARGKFESKLFEESRNLAEESLNLIKQAHQSALDYTRQKHQEKFERIKKIIAELESSLKDLSLRSDLSPEQLKLKTKSDENLALARKFFDEKAWGYAEMHARIGLKILRQMLSPASPENNNPPSSH